MTISKHIAIVGAGMAAITCARTLVQAGHQVTVFEKSRGVGGRMSTRSSAFGTFDHGTQYFTVRDRRFVKAMQTSPMVCRPWSANAVQVMDAHGHVVAAGLPGGEPHWVAPPGMNGLVRAWAAPLQEAHCVELQTRVTQIEPDALHPDQDFLNLHFAGRRVELPSYFNQQVGVYEKTLFWPLAAYQQKIIHYAGKLKPLQGNLAPGMMVFWMYTQWVPEAAQSQGRMRYVHPLSHKPHGVVREWADRLM
jgi:hypothetical protein